MEQFSYINDFSDKCRCCLKSINQNEQSITINSLIHQQFYDLTQISVRIYQKTEISFSKYFFFVLAGSFIC